MRAWAVMFSSEIIETMTGMDNGKVFQPLAIFESPVKALEWRKEKWMGKTELTDICEVEIYFPKRGEVRK